MQILVSHPTGNSNVRAIIKGFADAGILYKFYTSIAVEPHSFWLRFMPATIQQELQRRAFSINNSLVETYPWFEAARMILPKLGFTGAVKREVGWASTYKVYQRLDTFVAKRLETAKKKYDLAAVYAYEDGALETFKQAKRLGLTCIYDLPIAYWQTVRRLLQREAERLPGWAGTLGGGIQDSEAKLERKARELELADIVVAPSQFVAQSLPNSQYKKEVILSPFGSPAQALVNKEKKRNDNRPLRVLFVGSMGQRKGLADLFQAVKMLNTTHIELVVLGSPQAPMSFYKHEFSNFTYEPGRPHHEVLQLMQSCDVFCLPSIAEGRALVMQEAMSQGLPLIITPNTGGEDLIKEHQTGFLVPIASPAIIAEKLNWFLENRSAIPEMGQLAKEHAASYTWQRYTTTIVDSLMNRA